MAIGWLAVRIFQCLVLWNGYKCFPNNLTHLEYYGDAVTWNTAHSVCNQAGSRLLQIQDENKQTAFLSLWRNLMHTEILLQDLWNFGVWLNLVYNGDIFVWRSSSQPVTWSNWPNDPYADDVIESCVQVNHTTGLWENTGCHQLAFFVCEKVTGYSCVFRDYFSKRILLHKEDNSSVTRFHQFDYPRCLQMCQTTYDVITQMACWAVTVRANASASRHECYLHYGTLERVQDVALLKDDNMYKVYTRECYKGSYVDPGTIMVPSASTPAAYDGGHMDTSNTHGYSLTPITLTTTTTAANIISGNGLATTRLTSSAEAQENLCRCPCQTWSDAQKRLFLDTILTSLTINTSNLSSVRRKYVSAHDDRPTAQMLGYGGGVFLGLAVLLIICCDVDILLNRQRGDKIP